MYNYACSVTFDYFEYLWQYVEAKFKAVSY